MPEQITLRFKQTEDDYVSAMRLFYTRARKLHIKIDLVGGTAAVVIGAICWVVWGYELEWLFLLCAGAVLLGMISAAWYIIPLITFRSEPKFRDEYLVQFSEEGITFKTANIDSKLEWNLYNSVIENNDVYVLMYGKRVFSVIPKRAFADSNEETAFRELLKQKGLLE